MKSRKGFTPVRGKKEMGVGKLRKNLEIFLENQTLSSKDEKSKSSGTGDDSTRRSR
jgi:hypothetical protein